VPIDSNNVKSVMWPTQGRRALVLLILKKQWWFLRVELIILKIMKLAPRELEKLELQNIGLIAQKRLALGLRLVWKISSYHHINVSISKSVFML
jgi:hypothetical protein